MTCTHRQQESAREMTRVCTGGGRELLHTLMATGQLISTSSVRQFPSCTIHVLYMNIPDTIEGIRPLQNMSL